MEGRKADGGGSGTGGGGVRRNGNIRRPFLRPRRRERCGLLWRARVARPPVNQARQPRECEACGKPVSGRTIEATRVARSRDDTTIGTSDEYFIHSFIRKTDAIVWTEENYSSEVTTLRGTPSEKVDRKFHSETGRSDQQEERGNEGIRPWGPFPAALAASSRCQHQRRPAPLNGNLLTLVKASGRVLAQFRPLTRPTRLAATSPRLE